MFKCLVDSLTRPRNIAGYVNMKGIKFIGYFFLLVLISTVPSVVVTAFNPGISDGIADALVSDLRSTETTYHYKVVESTLIDVTGKNDTKIIQVGGLNSVFNENVSPLKTYFFFNPGDRQLVVPGEKDPYFAISLGSKELQISIETPKTTDGEINQMSGEAAMIKYRYEELGVINLDFSEINSYSTYSISTKFKEIIDIIIKPYLPIAYIVSLPSMLFTSASSIAIEILILSAIVFFFSRMSNVKFMEILKIITLSMTPSIVSTIFLLLPVGAMGYYVIYFAGQILTITYFYRALRQLVINKMIK